MEAIECDIVQCIRYKLETKKKKANRHKNRNRNESGSNSTAISHHKYLQIRLSIVTYVNST